ncbi:MAG TPA: glycoside hydrolase family 43 protein [Chitinophagaceae bacterium]|nr:glycoside hydrolase family 43 protein [Chitinophagaceae bacterium]
MRPGFPYPASALLAMGLVSLLISGISGSPEGSGNPKSTLIHNGKPWKDNRGKTINAHGAGLLYDHGFYYLFGEIKTGRTWQVPGQSWEDFRVKASGVSCYRSRDLLNWTYEGIALAPRPGSGGDLDTGRVIERPKVIYNAKTGKFVMWFHVDNRTYSYAHAGVAISDHPQGPYQYLGSYRPGGYASRDMTLFKDIDGKAYLVFSSEKNKTMHVQPLSSDYLRPSGNFNRILIGLDREAPAVFRFGKKYFLITSRCTGWDPNTASWAQADSMMGNWHQQGNPCTGPDSAITYFAQSAFVQPIIGKPGDFLFAADRWNKSDLPRSRYIWLPLLIRQGKPMIIWKKNWNLSFFTREGLGSHRQG